MDRPGRNPGPFDGGGRRGEGGEVWRLGREEPEQEGRGNERKREGRGGAPPPPPLVPPQRWKERHAPFRGGARGVGHDAGPLR